jgi:hypothetical protein
MLQVGRPPERACQAKRTWQVSRQADRWLGRQRPLVRLENRQVKRMASKADTLRSRNPGRKTELLAEA